MSASTGTLNKDVDVTVKFLRRSVVGDYPGGDFDFK